MPQRASAACRACRSEHQVDTEPTPLHTGSFTSQLVGLQCFKALLWLCRCAAVLFLKVASSEMKDIPEGHARVSVRSPVHLNPDASERKCKPESSKSRSDRRPNNKKDTPLHWHPPTDSYCRVKLCRSPSYLPDQTNIMHLHCDWSKGVLGLG